MYWGVPLPYKYELYCPNTMSYSPCGGFQKMYYPNTLNLPQTGFNFQQFDFFLNSKEKLDIISLFYLFFNEIIYVGKARLSPFNQTMVSLILIISFEYYWDTLIFCNIYLADFNSLLH